MKPSTHNDPESWRRTDAALRRALQQRCSNAPQLPEGFYERLQQRMAQEAGQQEAPVLAQRSPRRKPAPALWGRTAAAAAAVLAIAAGLGTWYRRPISPSAPNTPDSPTMATPAIVATTPNAPSAPTVATATAHVTTTAATARPTTATACFAWAMTHSAQRVSASR